MLAACPEPLNQGKQGTCSSHAFAQVISGILRLQYELYVPPRDVATVAKATCSQWNGIAVSRLCDEWNQKLPPLETEGSTSVLTVRIACKQLSFADACGVARKFRGTASTILVYISRFNVDNKPIFHAVAGFNLVDCDDPLIVCVNSWGGKEMHKYLSGQQCAEAFCIDVTAVHKKNDPQPLVPGGRLYLNLRDSETISRTNYQTALAKAQKLEQNLHHSKHLANAAEERATEAEERARSAEERERAAEERARFAVERARAAEERACEAEERARHPVELQARLVERAPLAAIYVPRWQPLVFETWVAMSEIFDIRGK